MTTPYAAAAAQTLALIQRAGAPLSYVHRSQGAADLATGLPATWTDTGGTVDAVVLPAPRDPNLTNEQNALVQRNQRRLLIAGSSWPFAIDPSPNDTVQAEGVVWTVKGSSRLAPDGGDPIVFTVDVAR